MSEIIRVNNVCYEYQQDEHKLLALNQISLSIERGEFVAVIGHNGSGKSTLAKLLNAILTPTSGSVLVEGMDTADEKHLFDIRQKVGMVFQNPDNQLVATLVEEDVAFAPENLGVPSSEIRQRVDDALKEVGMYEYRDRAPHQLSGGQKQRVAIAGILAMQPDCIVLDEATAMLDPRGRREVLSTIHRLNREKGSTIVHITHYMEEAVYADRVLVIDNGRLFLQGRPQEVFSQVEALKSVGLNVPQVTELIDALGQAGVQVDGPVLTKERCIEVLTQLLEGSSCQS